MELVDVHYNLELECEYGHPVEIETYFCHKCSQYHQEQNIDYSKIMVKLPSRVVHSIPGNKMMLKRMLFEKNKEILEDKRWKTELTNQDLQIFERIAGHLNRRLGYV